jgi:hypothetical protein
MIVRGIRLETGRILLTITGNERQHPAWRRFYPRGQGPFE